MPQTSPHAQAHTPSTSLANKKSETCRQDGFSGCHFHGQAAKRGDVFLTVHGRPYHRRYHPQTTLPLPLISRRSFVKLVARTYIHNFTVSFQSLQNAFRHSGDNMKTIPSQSDNFLSRIDWHSTLSSCGLCDRS